MSSSLNVLARGYLLVLTHLLNENNRVSYRPLHDEHRTKIVDEIFYAEICVNITQTNLLLTSKSFVQRTPYFKLISFRLYTAGTWG